MLTNKEIKLIKRKKEIYFAMGLCLAGYLGLCCLVVFYQFPPVDLREKIIKCLALSGAFIIIAALNTIVKLQIIIIGQYCDKSITPIPISVPAKYWGCLTIE